jgi:hypothetical protein
MLLTLSPRAAAALSDDAAAAACRLDHDVRLSLSGVAGRRSALLTRIAGDRYRAALMEPTTAAWHRFAAALRAVLCAADAAPREAALPAALAARDCLRGFLDENPDLGRDRSPLRPG